MKCYLLSRAWLFATPWTAAHQAPLSTGFSRQGYWSGLTLPSPGALPDLGIEPRSAALSCSIYVWTSSMTGNSLSLSLVHFPSGSSVIMSFYLHIWGGALSHVQLFATPWTGAHQAPLSMGFFRQAYWSGLSVPSPGELSEPGTELGFPTL